MVDTPLFTSESLSAFQVPGVTERWTAVQERIHPLLATLAEQVDQAARRALPRQWPLYEISYKSQRYINRGRGARVPIDEYHVAFDRPPRGAGVLVSVSGVEQAVLVGLQLWGVRKPQLRYLWHNDVQIWRPLIERIGQVGQARFAGWQGTEQRASTEVLWVERYLSTRQANYLWAGFVYPWAELAAHSPEQMIADVLMLLPLNEALMEQAEEPALQGPALLQEQRAIFAVQSPVPPIETLRERLRERGLAIDEKLLRAYHVALQTRPLVILPGISGTGKTRLTRYYADAYHGIASGAPNPYYLLVAVQPDWHSARDLLGYYNAFTERYHPTPFLHFVLQAAADPQQRYFVCLDEMNLARPEYYLAPLLSALETVEQTIDLGVPTAESQMVSGEQLRNPLRLPLNLSLIGTVNVDESSNTVSDKLLDRANVIELTDVDLAAFHSSYQGAIDPQAWEIISQMYEIVARAGQPFGYRTMTDMLRYIEQASGILSPQQAIDLQIKQKILPKLRGDDNPRLRQALTELLMLFLGQKAPDWSSAAHILPEQVAAAPFAESAEKVRRMLTRLDQDGFTDFYS